MLNYTLVKQVHVTTAVISLFLFLLRAGLDFSKKTHWRHTPLRLVPHVNDTLLLSAAIALVILGNWNPALYHWLAAKLVLVLGYIAAGFLALHQTLSWRTRIAAALLALVQIAFIFYLAIIKPVLW
ncbi:SirB2 family protein [Microbulbifer sp. 2205BS26-8]|uniref:SirB2 family protein n=1 Tax=Microbulbifer sp. 2205BS26-8 TaxID=3064386 RepID=UPI00273DDC19|nr:SirB2 family protein [Microbulbifer sp. 2205BS26-8]MDP5211084.1 SirB2 family protein [Microbulbifer sp. 2205BS26-8]